MLKTEIINVNNKELIKHYSDNNCYILQEQSGIKYSEAVDIIPCKYTYVETSEPIETPSTSTATECNVEIVGKGVTINYAKQI